MVTWEEFGSFLRCLSCDSDLEYQVNPKQFAQYPDINGELKCISCGRNYPLFQDIPIMFNDYERIKILIDQSTYNVRLKQTQKKFQRATQMVGNQLNRFKSKDNELSDAMGWEILFWERWKETDEGFLKFNRNSIENFLIHDKEGGGRLKFFNKVLSYSDGSLSNKYLLNIGAGRDFLLENFLEAGYKVVEQDIVLEPLFFLKERGASFCCCCDARSLPFKDDIFNVSTSFGVLHHIWPIEQSLAELLRVTFGNIHFNEPNYFAFERVAHLLPRHIEYKLKQFHSGNKSRSPYEAVINPYSLKKIVKKHPVQVIELSFPKSSWMSRKSRGIKRLLRMINLMLTRIFPIISSHFDLIIRKTTK